jgi:hypothetical protein
MEGTTHTRPSREASPFSWRRAGLALVLAAAGFFLPQEIPLEWYPLNKPGDDILQLEINCATDQDGRVQIFYNTTGGINERESISWAISPTAHTYTYTFPLPDAPITELRLDPVGAGGALIVRNLRIIDRRGAEIRRFTRDDIVPVQQIAGVSPLADGWKITSVAGSNDPFANIRLPAPILAKDLNHRNLLRCLLSGGYLALMLWILLLAVLFAFYRPRDWRDGLRHAGFMAALALMFSAVGNRGLIKNSVHYARFVPPPVPPGAILEIDLATDRPATAQLFWDSARGFNEADSVRAYYEPHPGLQTLRFALPDAPLKALRFDPLDDEARLAVRGVRVSDATRRTLAVLPLTALEAGADIATLSAGDGELVVTTAPGRKDPTLLFGTNAVRLINEALATRPRP